MHDLEAEFRKAHPAASNTDSPSRGVPRPIADPNKQITGGWGQGGGTQYYALDGTEVQKVVVDLMANLRAQMAMDLRFGIAAVYPQIRIRVQILVDGSGPDAPINEGKFDLGQHRILTLEALAQDDQDTPADALRDDAGIQKPMKQIVQAGAARILVDVPNQPLGAQE